MKNIFITTLLVLLLPATGYASHDLWKDGEEYKLISFAGEFQCPIKVDYILNGPGKVTNVKVTAMDKSLCSSFDISLSYSPFSNYPYDDAMNVRTQTITINWINPGSDVISYSELKVTLYEAIGSNKCFLGSSEITNKGKYPCLWDMLECHVMDPGGLSNEYLTIR